MLLNSYFSLFFNKSLIVNYFYHFNLSRISKISQYLRIVTPASGVGTTAVVLATARYYHSVLPP